MDGCLEGILRLTVLVEVCLEFFGGGVEGELMVGAPEVQGVAADAALETAVDVPLGVHREDAGWHTGSANRFAERAAAAKLSAATDTRLPGQPTKYLFDL